MRDRGLPGDDHPMRAVFRRGDRGLPEKYTKLSITAVLTLFSRVNRDF